MGRNFSISTPREPDAQVLETLFGQLALQGLVATITVVAG